MAMVIISCESTKLSSVVLFFLRLHSFGNEYTESQIKKCFLITAFQVRRGKRLYYNNYYLLN